MKDPQGTDLSTVVIRRKLQRFWNLLNFSSNILNKLFNLICNIHPKVSLIKTPQKRQNLWPSICLTIRRYKLSGTPTTPEVLLVGAKYLNSIFCHTILWRGSNHLKGVEEKSFSRNFSFQFAGTALSSPNTFYYKIGR